MRSAALLVVLGLGSGCATHAQAKRAAVIGGIATLVGIASFRVMLEYGDRDASNTWNHTVYGASELTFLLGMVIGAPVFIGGIAGLIMHPPPPPPECETAGLSDAAARDHPRACDDAGSSGPSL
jgi:hypothetical protein